MNTVKLKEIRVSGLKTIEEVIVSHFHLMSILINAGWFPNEPELVIEVNQMVEIDKYCQVVQFTGRDEKSKNILPCLATVMININPEFGLIVFKPIQIIGLEEATYLESLIHQNGDTFDGKVKVFFPSFDLVINDSSNPTNGLIIIKILASYSDQNDENKIVANTDITLMGASFNKNSDFDWQFSFQQIPT